MIQTISLQVTPVVAASEFKIKQSIAAKQGIRPQDINQIAIKRRSIDARSPRIMINLEVLCALHETKKITFDPIQYNKQNVSNKPAVHIVGMGPAGMFAALQLIELGYKPIILERGKDVSERKRDIATLNKNEGLDENSNYCFGEGGAGTFSDGKLYTRSKKKGDNKRVLELFVLHGAAEDTLIDTHPHLGTDCLPAIMNNMRTTILDCGGEVHFNTVVENFVIRENTITALITNKGEIEVADVLLATGHSAREMYYIMHDAGIELEAKPCAMGVRAEHPQDFVNQVQYHGSMSEYLPTASYSLVQQVRDRGVYSFCMCPGGIIVPSATGPKQTVVNGMSNSKRNSPFANSGIAVEIRVEDYADFAEYGVLAGLKFQENLEYLAYTNGGSGQIAPAQRIRDFIKNKVSSDLPECSYIPGIISSPMHFWLPEHISKRLKEAFIEFNKKMRGYADNDGIIVGVESRTSSPVRIPRNPETLSHIRVTNLFPCGEGAGYAGGIVSSAIDGMTCAQKIAEKLNCKA